ALFENVAHAAHGVQQAALERRVDLGTQPLDRHLDYVGVGVEVDVPHHFGDRGLRHDLALVTCQHGEQRKLFGGEFNAAAVAEGLARQQIDHQVTDAYLRRLVLATAACQYLQARQQFQEGERLDQIVV